MEFIYRLFDPLKTKHKVVAIKLNNLFPSIKEFLLDYKVTKCCIYTTFNHIGLK